MRMPVDRGASDITPPNDSSVQQTSPERSRENHRSKASNQTSTMKSRTNSGQRLRP